MGPFSPPTVPERRDVITPYAFQVHPALLGLPLAQPWRRAVAIAIDGVLIGLLALVPSPLLGLVTGAVAFRWVGKTQHPWAMRWRGTLRVCAVVFLLISATLLAGFLLDVDGNQPSAMKAERVIIEWSDDDLGFGLGWAALYFTVFSAWWNGQTPGKRLLGIRVVQLDGTPISLWEAFERCGGYGAGLATGLLGFIQIWWDPNRQAIHDKIAETVVIRGDVPVTGEQRV